MQPRPYKLITKAKSIFVEVEEPLPTPDEQLIAAINEIIALITEDKIKKKALPHLKASIEEILKTRGLI